MKNTNQAKNEYDVESFDSNFVEYAYDMLSYRADYEQTFSELEKVSDKTFDEGKAVIENELQERLCSSCDTRKFFDEKEQSFYCPICE